MEHGGTCFGSPVVHMMETPPIITTRTMLVGFNIEYRYFLYGDANVNM